MVEGHAPSSQVGVRKGQCRIESKLNSFLSIPAKPPLQPGHERTSQEKILTLSAYMAIFLPIQAPNAFHMFFADPFLTSKGTTSK